ncbi:sugar ABC transporter ATP-binding protein [Pseudonocardia kunmingensis]|uniref:Monosaccharide ABC transporter ATP-binding protein (CUT2 family) n=1 Tax=Pseudonocardia kunmingensis TaxID=630975 RepID=A0A543E072_9PSEU|nr:monosaccharide ABC transporter ATP-binding protein (CUT2 family) [Pseudonocardia kunmingensis]
MPDSSGALVTMSGITKRFAGVLACADVDLAVRPGEVRALLGENGAGKSTLMNVLAGVITDHEGTITVAGREHRFRGPADAQAAGIAMIHQELDLVPGLSVAENIFLGREPRTRLRTVDARRMAAAAAAQLAELGVELDPTRAVGSLRVGEQQLVEIAKALSTHSGPQPTREPRGARVLIMDEPTAALADAEVRLLFATIDRLRERGVAIVYISHRMEEIEEIADRATVMRNGRVAGTVDPRTASRQDVIELMVGRAEDEQFGTDGDTTPGAVLLEVRNLALHPKARRAGRTDPAGIDLTVHAGEIVGLAGLMGAGRTELLESLYGAAPAGRRTGSVRLDGRDYAPSGPRAALARGVGFVSEDRRRSGLQLQHPVAHNIVLTALRSLCTAGVVRLRRERRAVREQIAALGIRAASPAVPVGTLSGGNQQKVVFARQLLARPRLLLLDEPTRGIDIGAKAELYRLLRSLADDGLGILFASSELPELLGVCDRIVVLRGGRVAADMPRHRTNQAAVLAAAMGSTPEGQA